jgi:hypothetical protein
VPAADRGTRLPRLMDVAAIWKRIRYNSGQERPDACT